MRSVSSRKYLYIFLSIVALCAYGFFVFAAPLAPGATLDPTCSPGATDCRVSLGWELNTASNYVYNTTDSIGIGDSTPAAALTVGNGDLFQVNSAGAIAAVTGYIQGSGTMSLTSANTTQGTTSSIFALNGNSLTTGTGFYAASSTLSSGPLMSLVVNSTAAAGGTQKALNISTTGVNATAGQRTYGGYFINSHSGSTSANVALYASASGGTTNYAALFPAGNVGIGILSPTSTLDILGQISVVESLNAASSTTSIVHNFGTTLSATGNTTGSSYVGSESLLTWSGGAFDATSAGALGMSAALAYAETASGTSGTVDLLIGQNAFAVHNGSGTVSRLRGSRLSALNAGTGTVADLIGSSISTNNSSTGAVTAAMGSSVELTNAGAGTTTSAIGSDLKVIASGGVITDATVLNLRAFSSGSATVTTATGILVQASNFGSYQPGIEATGTASGIYFNQTNNLGTDYAAVAGADVYGIYFGDKSLTGSNSEYALYLNDAEAENYFKNGLRIGADVDANKFASSTHGASSTVMYIGNSTIDVTAPSDERTKTNIESTAFGLDALNQINVVDFNYRQNIISDNNERHSGVLAQQVQSIYPEAVTLRTDGYFMVDYKTFIPLLMKSVQQLDIKIKAIEAQANTLATNETFLGGLRNWFADAGNGIVKLFSAEIETKKLCVADDAGDKTCVTKTQLDQILLNQTVTPVQPDPSPAPTPDPTLTPPSDEPVPTPSPEPEPVVDPAPMPEPTPDPVPTEPAPTVTE